MDNDGVGSSDVLVVDDNPGDIRFIQEAFEGAQLDLTVHTVNSRDEAIDFVSRRTASEGAPRLDAVLLDWNLSRATGEEVLLAAKSGDSPVPVIVMTGTKAEMDSVKSALSRADLYMEKPTDPEEYVDALRTVLNGR